MAGAYYNENDRDTADMLRCLIREGHVAPGDVDTRSIEDVKPIEIKDYTQCHFFAGLGLWSLALRQAGWSDDRPVWTGSCPCQPFSKAGEGKGFADERHLWPSWFHLIRVLRPITLFGEQASNSRADEWLNLVQSDLEGESYAFGPVVLPACGFGAPQIRERSWFVGDSDIKGLERLSRHVCEVTNQSEWSITLGPVAPPSVLHQPVSGPWSPAEWRLYRDGIYRPSEPGTLPVAHGHPGLLAEVHAIGNAIVPEVAKHLIQSYMKARELP